MQKASITVSKHFVINTLSEGVFAAIAEDGGSAIKGLERIKPAGCR
jgi:hypothetical protein